MQTSVAETTKPPAYPFIFHQCQRTKHQNTKHTGQTQYTLGQPDRRSSMFSLRRGFRLASATVPDRLVCRGEGVFRDLPYPPQEKNEATPTFFRHRPNVASTVSGLAFCCVDAGPVAQRLRVSGVSRPTGWQEGKESPSGIQLVAVARP